MGAEDSANAGLKDFTLQVTYPTSCTARATIADSGVNLIQTGKAQMGFPSSLWHGLNSGPGPKQQPIFVQEQAKLMSPLLIWQAPV